MDGESAYSDGLATFAAFFCTSMPEWKGCQQSWKRRRWVAHWAIFWTPWIVLSLVNPVNEQMQNQYLWLSASWAVGRLCNLQHIAIGPSWSLLMHKPIWNYSYHRKMINHRLNIANDKACSGLCFPHYPTHNKVFPKTSNQPKLSITGPIYNPALSFIYHKGDRLHKLDHQSKGTA